MSPHVDIGVIISNTTKYSKLFKALGILLVICTFGLSRIYIGLMRSKCMSKDTKCVNNYLKLNEIV